MRLEILIPAMLTAAFYGAVVAFAWLPARRPPRPRRYRHNPSDNHAGTGDDP